MIDFPLSDFLSTFFVVFVLSVPIFALFFVTSPVRQGIGFLFAVVTILAEAFVVALVATAVYTLFIMFVV